MTHSVSIHTGAVEICPRTRVNAHKRGDFAVLLIDGESSGKQSKRGPRTETLQCVCTLRRRGLVMPSVHTFNQRTRTTHKSLEELLKLHEKVTPMQLAAKLYPEEAALLEEIVAFLDSVPDAIQRLQPDDLKLLRAIAEELENGRRRSRPLKILARKILCAPSSDFQVEKAHAARLRDLFEQALVQDVQTRVHELRLQLPTLGTDDHGQTLTVSRSPYRLLRVDWTLSDEDMVALEAVYPMFDRQAWKGPPSYMETKAFRLAQERLRFALATGMILADDGTPLLQQGVRKCSLSTAVRDQLDWVVEVSDKMQQIFEIFYAPCATAWERDRFYALAEWAEPHAVDIVRFILACRNEILRVMNAFFTSIGQKPWPAVQGHDFPQRLVPPGRIPQQPFLVLRDDLLAMHRRLREIGVNYLSRAA